MAELTVLETTELLESISAELPFKTILKVKIICQRWNQVIEQSAKIRQALFLLPHGALIRPAPAAEGIDRWPGFEALILENGPFKLSMSSRSLLELRHMNFHCWVFYSSTPCSKGIRMMSHCKHTDGPGAYGPRWWQYRGHEDGVGTKSYLWWYYPEHFSPKTGLNLPPVYRSMYLTQPPITPCKLAPSSYVLKTDVAIYNPDGITLGQIADLTAKILQQSEQYDEDGVKKWHQWYWSDIDEAPMAATWRVLTDEAKTRDPDELIAELNARNDN